MTKLTDLKVKNSIVVKYEDFNKNLIEVKGLVFQVLETQLRLIRLDGVLVSIDRRYIKSDGFCRTRFPKNISDNLKDMYNYYQVQEELQRKERDIRSEIRSHEDKKAKILDQLLKSTFESYFDDKNAMAFLDKEIPRELKYYNAITIGKVQDANIDIGFWYNTKTKKPYIYIDYVLKDRGHKYKEIHIVPDRRIVDDYSDFDSLANKYAPNKKELIERIFKDSKFIKNVTEEKSASSGDKAYVYITSRYRMELKFNKKNFKEFYDLLINNLKELKRVVGN